jgi:hypothetical protein
LHDGSKPPPYPRTGLPTQALSAHSSPRSADNTVQRVAEDGDPYDIRAKSLEAVLSFEEVNQIGRPVYARAGSLRARQGQSPCPTRATTPTASPPPYPRTGLPPTALPSFFKKNEPFRVRLCWHLPIVPGRLQPSIVGTSELNFRVRNGNGWILTVIDTNLYSRRSFHRLPLNYTPPEAGGGIEP